MNRYPEDPFNGSKQTNLVGKTPPGFLSESHYNQLVRQTPEVLGLLPDPERVPGGYVFRGIGPTPGKAGFPSYSAPGQQPTGGPDAFQGFQPTVPPATDVPWQVMGRQPGGTPDTGVRTQVQAPEPGLQPGVQPGFPSSRSITLEGKVDEAGRPYYGPSIASQQEQITDIYSTLERIEQLLQSLGSIGGGTGQNLVTDRATPTQGGGGFGVPGGPPTVTGTGIISPQELGGVGGGGRPTVTGMDIPPQLGGVGGGVPPTVSSEWQSVLQNLLPSFLQNLPTSEVPTGGAPPGMGPGDIATYGAVTPPERSGPIIQRFISGLFDLGGGNGVTPPQEIAITPGEDIPGEDDPTTVFAEERAKELLLEPTEPSASPALSKALAALMEGTLDTDAMVALTEDEMAQFRWIHAEQRARQEMGLAERELTQESAADIRARSIAGQEQRAQEATFRKQRALDREISKNELAQRVNETKEREGIAKAQNVHEIALEDMRSEQANKGRLLTYVLSGMGIEQAERERITKAFVDLQALENQALDFTLRQALGEMDVGERALARESSERIAKDEMQLERDLVNLGVGSETADRILRSELGKEEQATARQRIAAENQRARLQAQTALQLGALQNPYAATLMGLGGQPGGGLASLFQGLQGLGIEAPQPGPGALPQQLSPEMASALGYDVPFEPGGIPMVDTPALQPGALQNPYTAAMMGLGAQRGGGLGPLLQGLQGLGVQAPTGPLQQLFPGPAGVTPPQEIGLAPGATGIGYPPGVGPLQQLFPGGTPTLGALAQTDPASLSFLETLLGLAGATPDQLAQQAAAVTPGIGGPRIGLVRPGGR